MKTSGPCGERVFYHYDDGRLIIEGTGPMWDYELEIPDPELSSPFYDTPWAILPVYNVLVRRGVTRIGNGAFYRSADLNTVMLSDTLTEIGRYAFAKSALEHVWFPDSLQSIETHAFFDCGRLQHVLLPGNIRLGDNSFAQTGMASLKFRGKLISAGDLAFWNNVGLYEVKLPPCGDLGYGLFDSCGMTSVDLSESGLERLPDYMFCCCDRLRDVILPPRIRSLGKGSFMVTDLTELELPATVEEFCPDSVSGSERLKTIIILGSSAPRCADDSPFYQRDLKLAVLEDAEGFDVMPWSGQTIVRLTKTDVERMRLL